ncbi:hypothetical protein KC573_02305 [candidate division WWE3 bacterium]|uniref:Uncharacterized protein n=1 Tax=candidate division WWE3 bacterium TaxID=2053526 RepID=A0A955LVW6_UNCKA|nr:hypothetical protein [candidate division WWE3 bacterium]
MSNFEANHSLDDVTFTTVPLGETNPSGFTPVWLTDFRKIETDKLAVHTFEYKYPSRAGFVDVSPFKQSVIEALKSETVTVSEALSLVENSKLYWVDTPTDIPTDEDIIKQTQAEYKRFGLEPSKIVQESVNAVKLVIEDLMLPEDVKVRILQQLNKLEIQVGYARGGGATQDGELVYINPSDSLAQARYLSEIVGVEVNSDMLKSLLVGQISHELGHIVDFTVDNKTILNSSLSASSMLRHEASYPVKFDNPESDNSQLQMRERFAMYFAYATLEKMGLTTEAESDFKKIYLTMAFDVFKNVSVKRLTEFVEEARNSQKLDKITRAKVVSLGEMVLSGHCIAQAIPLTKEQVYEALLSISTSKNRLERAMQKLAVDGFEAELEQKDKGYVLP